MRAPLTGIDRVGSGKDSGLFLALGGAVDFGDALGAQDIILHRATMIRRGDLAHQGLLGGEHQESRAPESILGAS